MNRREFFQGCLGKSLGFYCLLNPTWKQQGARLRPENQTGTSHVMTKVLGTAQDGGIPHAGCYCPNCQRARSEPRFARMISSLAIFDRSEKHFFLIDATPDVRQQLDLACHHLGLDSPESRVPPHGILLTHAHIGHYTGLIFFGYEALATKGLPVYCSQRMNKFLRENGPWSQLVNQENISLRILELDKENRIAPRILVIPFLVPHRDEYSDTLGFLVSGPQKKLLYIPDIQNWDAWDRDIQAEVRKADYALLDGTFFGPDELPRRDLSQIGHPFILDSMKILQKVAESKKQQICFTHFNHSNPALDPNGAARREIEEKGFSLAEEGMEFPL